MADTRNYSIKKNRITEGLLENMSMEGEDRLEFENGAGVRSLFLKAIDSGMQSAEWGRFTFSIEADDSIVTVVRAGASDSSSFLDHEELRHIDDFLTDQEEGAARKKQLFEKMGAVKAVNRNDMLLYSLSGRYLWLYIEILGEGSGSISGMRLNMEGDNFMDTFPEIYRERNSFFHRYISIFSSMYNDLQLETEKVADRIDVDTAPCELLPVFAGWLGIDAGNDILSDDQLRTLIKEGYGLCKYKGTRSTIERICEIVLGERVTLIEKNEMSPLISYDEKETYDRLFGESSHDLTVLINGHESRTKRAQLTFLLDQFKPVRTRINLVFMSDRNMLDSYTFLDDNALIKGETDAALDNSQSLDGTEVLL